MKLTRYIAGIVLIMASACANKQAEEKTASEPVSDIVEMSPEQSKNAALATDSLVKKPIANVIKVSGKIDVPPQNMVSISAPMSGFLRYTKLLPGMHLSKGEVIAIMEDQAYVQLQHDYLTAGYELDFLEKEYLRQKALATNKAVSEKSYEQALAAYKMKRTDRMSLAAKLKIIGIDPENLTENSISSSIKLFSPIDGFVSQVKVNIGKYIQASEILFELVNPEDIHLNLTVFEKDLPHISIGQKVKAYSNSHPEKIYPCEIILIGQDVSADRHVEVHCHFDNYNRSLIPGMYMNGEIETELKDRFVIKSSAVVSFEGKQFVFVQLSDLKFKMMPVNIGVTENGWTEIKEQESLEGKKLVVNGAYEMLMMLKNIEEEE